METRLSLAPGAGKHGCDKDSLLGTALRERIKAAGAIWRPRHRVWEVDWKTVRELGLQGRVVPDEPG